MNELLMDPFVLILVFVTVAASVSQGKDLCWNTSNGSPVNDIRKQICIISQKSLNVTVTSGESLKLNCTFQTHNNTLNCAIWKKDGRKYPADSDSIRPDGRTVECLLNILKATREHNGIWTCGTKANDYNEGVLANISVNVISPDGSHKVTNTVPNEIQDKERNSTATKVADISNGTLLIIICVVAAVVILLVVVKTVTCLKKRSKICKSKRKSNEKEKSPTPSHHQYEEIDEDNILPITEILELQYLPMQPKFQETQLTSGTFDLVNPADLTNKETLCHSHQHFITSGTSAHGIPNEIYRNSMTNTNAIALRNIPKMARNPSEAHSYHNIQFHK